MNQYLEALEKMKDMQIVRFFSQFFTEDRLSPFVTDLKQSVLSGHAGSLAKELLVWAVILALGAFVIDQVFYWTGPGQLEQAKANWRSFTAGVANLGESARVLAGRAKALWAQRKFPRGRR